MAIAALAGSAIAEDRQPNTKDIQILAQDSSGRTLALASNPVKTARGSLPRADELVFGSGFSGTINQTSLNATWNFRYTTMSDGLLISNFKFRQAPTRSAQQLGLGNVNDFAVLFAPYFAQFPDADYAVAWVETGTAVASGLSASFTSTNTLPRTLYPFMPCSDQVPMRLTASGGPLGDGIAGLYIDGIVSDLQICVAADPSGTVGHSFVEFQNGLLVRWAFGKYPEPTIPIGDVPGKIKDDGARACGRRLCFRVTADQYNRALSFAVSQNANPSTYNLFSANCVDWARQIATLAGLPLPSSTECNVGICYNDPRVLNDAFGGLSSPYTGACGVVRSCTLLRPQEKLIERGLAPLSWSPSGLRDALLDEPESVAALVGSTVIVYEPESVAIRTGANLTAIADAFSSDSAMIASQWSGNVRMIEQGNVTSYQYTAPGTYEARISLFEDGAVHILSLNVQVSDSGEPGDRTVAIQASDEPSVSVANEGNDISEPIPLIPVASCQTDCNTNSIPDCDEPHPVAGLDCNLNGVLDACDISNGVSLDSNLDGICDECQQVACLGDANSDGNVNFADITNSLENWGATYPPTIGAGPGDADDDGVVNFGDITAVLQTWGSSCNL